MKKGLIIAAVVVLVAVGLAFGADFLGLANLAAEPKPGS